MGATVTTNRLAAAFRGATGVVYALFEQTYSKNITPHMSTWGCVAFGPIEAVMRTVFLLGAECEGGSLQMRSGPVKPETYIGVWLHQLANPVELEDRRVGLTARSLDRESQHSTYVCDELEKHGYAAAANALRENREATLSLHQDHAVLCAIFDGSPLAPWHMFASGWAPVRAATVADLGYRPKSCTSFTAVHPAVWKVAADDENRLVPDAQGIWRCQGWPYRIVGQFILNLWRSELQEPGSYRKRIEVYRSAVETAPVVPSGCGVAVDVEKEQKSGYGARLVADLPAKVEGQRRGHEFVFPIPASREELFLVTSQLSTSSTRWIVPDLPSLGITV